MFEFDLTWMTNYLWGIIDFNRKNEQYETEEIYSSYKKYEDKEDIIKTTLEQQEFFKQQLEKQLEKERIENEKNLNFENKNMKDKISQEEKSQGNFLRNYRKEYLKK